MTHVSIWFYVSPHNGNTSDGSFYPEQPLGPSPHCPVLEWLVHYSSHTEGRTAWNKQRLLFTLIHTCSRRSNRVKIWLITIGLDDLKMKNQCDLKRKPRGREWRAFRRTTTWNIVEPQTSGSHIHSESGTVPLPVVVLDTVGVVVVISDERRPLEYARARAAAETVSMEALAHCL